MKYFAIPILGLFLVACNGIGCSKKLFTLLDSSQTGINFVNKVVDSKDLNIYTYRNFYNGGGVSIGDVNSDGLPDIYFTANMGPNKLYLNKGVKNGNFQFEDISKKAGVEGTKIWSTGVTMADVNGDGFLDIYVCNSGGKQNNERKNELFINNGNSAENSPSFIEKAEEYGLADDGLSTQASFFDYDHDGDLDMYLLNNSFRAIGSFNMAETDRNIRNELGGDKFFENQNGKFIDISEKAGIYGSEIGFGLGVVTSDFNGDGWLDLYICNDFFERDYLYINDKNGHFSEELTTQMPSISQASMGADAADLNGDGLPELFVTEMLPQQEERLKTSMTFENWEKLQYAKKNGYHNQFTRNMLQLNNGSVAGNNGSFSEIGRYAGVEATDWSWSALMADLDNDGFKDLFITNGIYKDILNQDYLKFISNESFAKTVITKTGVDYKKLIDIIPSKPIANYVYQGSNTMKFNDVTNVWGFETPGFSNGSAYSDLDNDGDLDLVVNNVNASAFVYKNETNEQLQNSFLKIKLVGNSKNTKAIGAKVIAYSGGNLYMQELIPSRGFQSAVDNTLNIGLGKNNKIDSLKVIWPTGLISKKYNFTVNQTITFEEKTAKFMPENKPNNLPKSSILTQNNLVDSDYFSHLENEYNDFTTITLLFHMNSTEGPKMAVGDINNDGLDDVYICGAAGYSGKLLVQKTDGNFTAINHSIWETDKNSEDTDAQFFDADNDGDLDLYVASGGSEFIEKSIELSDRLYFNNQGNFKKSFQFLPTILPENTSCVRPADFDKDGDLDLFVGIRAANQHFGNPQTSYLLENNGKGIFKEFSLKTAPVLKKIGMIKDAQWFDYEQDNDLDLLIVGEWMHPILLRNSAGVLEDISAEIGLKNLTGWWNAIKIADLDLDGDADFILGNHGLNSRFRATETKPISMHIADFDNNSATEQIISTFNGEKSYPMALHQNITSQLPYLKSKYLKNESYKNQTITDIFSSEQLQAATKLEVNFLESTVLLNNGKQGFSISKLPFQAQFAPIYAIEVTNLNNDKFPDLVLAGNFLEAKPEVGAYDASRGLALIGKGNGTFNYMPANVSGINIEGQFRDIKTLKIKGKNNLVFVKNNGSFQFFQKK